MSALNRAKISEKLYKQLDKKGLLKEVIILRAQTSVYKEKMNDLFVCKIKGYYHREEARVESEATQSATINKLYNNKFLIIVDDNSKKIKQDDFFTLDNVKYKIIDNGNIEDIVYDMYLQRM
jgi:ribosomal 30S subunit maturation factor RimM